MAAQDSHGLVTCSEWTGAPLSLLLLGPPFLRLIDPPRGYVLLYTATDRRWLSRRGREKELVSANHCGKRSRQKGGTMRSCLRQLLVGCATLGAAFAQTV